MKVQSPPIEAGANARSQSTVKTDASLIEGDATVIAVPSKSPGGIEDAFKRIAREHRTPAHRLGRATGPQSLTSGQDDAQALVELRASLQREASFGSATDTLGDGVIAAGARAAAAPSVSPSPGPLDAGTKEVNPSITVWAREGRLTSDGKTRKSTLKQTVRLDDDGVRTRMVHVSGLTVLTSVVGHEPFAAMQEGAETVVTSDAFDQAQALATTEEFLGQIAKHGVDLLAIYRDRDANDGVLRLILNQTSKPEAAYATGSNSYITGTAEGGFHLASCKDILIHELGHGFVDHVARGLTADDKGEGKPFHEAIADLFAALYFGNPNISEDFAAYLASRHKTSPEDAKALRCLKNEAVLSPKIKEEHARSLVYSGMMWSVTEKLAARVGADKAHDLMFGVMVKTPFVLTSKSPSPMQIARAFADAARAALDPATAKQVVADLHEEAVKRHVIDAKDDLSASADDQPTKEMRLSLDDKPKKSGRASLLPANLVAEAANRLPAFAARKDIRLEVFGDRSSGYLRRVTLRCVAEDPKTHASIPVEDGLLEVIFDRAGLRSLSGGALSLPATFTFEAKDQNAAADYSEAKDLVARHLDAEAPKNAGADAARRSFATLFDRDNVHVERVMSEGRLCLEVRTMAGEFIVDLRSGAVKIRRLLHVEAGL